MLEYQANKRGQCNWLQTQVDEDFAEKNLMHEYCALATPSCNATLAAVAGVDRVITVQECCTERFVVLNITLSMFPRQTQCTQAIELVRACVSCHKNKAQSLHLQAVAKLVIVFPTGSRINNGS